MLNKMVLLFLSIIFLDCILYVQNVCTKDIPQIEQKVIVEADWGSKEGQVGEVPVDLEDQTPGPSINPIAVDSRGNVYIGDSVNYRIQKLMPS